MEVTIIFPNQLFFDNPSIGKNRKILLVNHPIFFSNKYFNFHKQKLLLHISSINYYEKRLKHLGYSVKIIQQEDYDNFIKKDILNFSKIHTCELVDLNIIEDLKKIGKKIIYYKSPMFMESNEENFDYFSDKKKFLLLNFYKKLRIKHEILVDSKNIPVQKKWTFDTENRKNIPKNLILPKIKTISYDDEIVGISKNNINNYYPSNIGNIDSFNYPVSHKQASINLENFFEHKFANFGKYQDAIINNNTFLFHSNISSSLNIGLLTPYEVISKAIDFSKYNNIPINSLEGFIRQILGWREFIKGIYIYQGKNQMNSNYWNVKNKLSPKFYDATTGILPVDDSISKSLNFSYVHHIERLMILGNFMLLLEIAPMEIYKWFMEMYIDSYSWVMVPNVFGMSQFADGGLMSTKPYISSSNYILKMSNYKKDKWSKIWDALYWDFIEKHTEKIESNFRMRMMINILNKKSNKEKLEIKNISNNYKNILLS
ncbi:MAG: cryptochrome/photolyase family protein [Dehalococcoidia bacterium]